MEHIWIRFLVRNNTFTSTVVHTLYDSVPKLQTVEIRGVESSVKNVFINNTAINFRFDSNEKVLLVTSILLRICVIFKTELFLPRYLG